MLRLSDGKALAHIWDALVVPGENNDSEFNKLFVLGEIRRVGDIFKKCSLG